jgi:hypothetical protein
MSVLFKLVRKDRRSRRAVAFAEQEQRRLSSIKFFKESLDKVGKRRHVGINPEEELSAVLSINVPETRTRCVDEHKVSHIEKAVGVLRQLVGWPKQLRGRTRHNMLGTERAHVEPDARTSRSAIEEKDGRAARQ